MAEEKDNLLTLIAEEIAEKAYEKFSVRLSQSTEPLAYSMEEAAKKINVSLSAFKKMVSLREIAVVRRGTRVIVPRKSLEDWIDRLVA